MGKKTQDKSAGKITPDIFRAMLSSVSKFCDKYRDQMSNDKNEAAIRDYWWCYVVNAVCELENAMTSVKDREDIILTVAHTTAAALKALSDTSLEDTALGKVTPKASTKAEKSKKKKKPPVKVKKSVKRKAK